MLQIFLKSNKLKSLKKYQLRNNNDQKGNKDQKSTNNYQFISILNKEINLINNKQDKKEKNHKNILLNKILKLEIEIIIQKEGILFYTKIKANIIRNVKVSNYLIQYSIILNKLIQFQKDINNNNKSVSNNLKLLFNQKEMLSIKLINTLIFIDQDILCT
jgi:flagellar hook-basal body complex protein FliE